MSLTRRPRGTSAGGQFAATQTAEADVVLDESDPWGAPVAAASTALDEASATDPSTPEPEDWGGTESTEARLAREEYDAAVRKVMLDQIGRGNILSISGGRVTPLSGPEGVGVELPVAHGWRVRVRYDEGSDTYAVARVQVRRRGGELREYPHGERHRVYCEEVGERAYRAGMWVSFEDDEW